MWDSHWGTNQKGNTMALDLASLAGKRATLFVEFMGDVVVVEYDPTYITQENYQEMLRGGADEFQEFFLNLVKSWDITSGDNPWPLDAEHLKITPLRLLRAIFSAIQDAPADKESGKD